MELIIKIQDPEGTMCFSHVQETCLERIKSMCNGDCNLTDWYSFSFLENCPHLKIKYNELNSGLLFCQGTHTWNMTSQGLQVKEKQTKSKQKKSNSWRHLKYCWTDFLSASSSFLQFLCDDNSSDKCEGGGTKYRWKCVTWGPEWLMFLKMKCP